MSSRNAPVFAPALRALCMHPVLPAIYCEAGERLAFTNAAFATECAGLFERAAEDLAGETLGSVSPALADLALAATAGARPSYAPGAVRGTDGRCWDAHALPYVDEHGECRGAVIYLQPNSDGGRAGAELDRLKTDFLNTLSHELRTPLSTVMAYLEFLEEGMAGELNETQREFVCLVEASARQLLTLIDDMLDLARLEAGRLHLTPSPVDVCLLLRELLPRYAGAAAARHVRLTMAPEAEALPARADHTRLVQILGHLLDNALKFTPAGGQVTVRCGSRGSGAVEVAVEDTGTGIPEEALPRVFQKFSQGESSMRREQGGAGLGLALCKRLVEAQGGTIGLLSRPGGGTRVWFTLPVWEGEA